MERILTDDHVAVNLLSEIRRTVQANRMLVRTSRVLIAFSAGPDSVCLLDALHRLYGKKTTFSLVYVDHGLRPKRAINREKKLTRHYARVYDVPCKILRVKVDTGSGLLGTEGEARKVRYQALLAHARAVRAGRIALGHNLDDVVETFFMNMVRGSGATGLTAIPAVRPPFIRPLIAVRKKEILGYLRTERLAFAVDETNRRLKYRRNYLRHRIIPMLEKINPGLHQAIRRQIDLLRSDNDYLERRSGSAYRKVVRSRGIRAAIDIAGLMRYTTPIRNRILRQAVRSCLGDLAGFESKHIDAIFSLSGKESGKRIMLPKGLTARRERGRIVIRRQG